MAEWDFGINDGHRGRVSMAEETRAETERRESRERREAMLTALSVAAPGGGTVIVDGQTFTVLDLRSLGLRTTSD